MNVAAGTPVVVGDRLVPMPDLAAGDRLLPVHRTGDLLVVSADDQAAAAAAVGAAAEAFRAMADVPDDDVTDFFESFAAALGDDRVWGRVAEANAADMRKARSTARLEATDVMRAQMVEGLRGWASTPGRRGEVVETREADGYRIERRIAPLGVVAFVFEGRPNVFADGAGVLRNGNTAAMRIGSDALGTAIAIEEHALRPALSAAGLPTGAVSLVRSASHGAAHALFTMPQVGLAVARGSGRAVALLGSVAEQHGIPVSLHGTGGAWLYLASDAPGVAARNAVLHSVDRKVCNTLNVLLVQAASADRLLPLALDALRTRDPQVRLHVEESSADLVAGAEPMPWADFGREWEWEDTPEVSIAVVEGDDEAVDAVNRHSPRFVASIVTASPERFERFYARTDVPYVGNAFTRWVDGQWAWGRPELGLTNWERGRLMGRSGILAGDDVFTVRDVFVDATREAPQRR